MPKGYLIFLLYVGAISLGLLLAQIGTKKNPGKKRARRRTIEVVVGHPWAQPDEVVLTYLDDYEVAHRIGWKTKRIMTENGNEYPTETMYPKIVVFVKREELKKRYSLKETQYNGDLKN